MSASDTRFARFLLGVLVLCSAIIILQLIHACAQHNQEVCRPAEDFILFYKAGHQAVSSDATTIYDTNEALRILGVVQQHKTESYQPLLYPPHSLLFLSVLGPLDYYSAFFLWFFAPVILFFACLNSNYVQTILPTSLSFYSMLPIVFPFLLIIFLSGQNATLWASLFILVMALRKNKPIVAGLVLSLFSIKPQLGIFLPLLLLYEKNWMTLMVAVIATLAMMVLSMLIWGAEIWVSYYQLLGIFSQITKTTPASYMFVSASPFMGLLMLGINLNAALALQGILSLMVLTGSWEILEKCKAESQIILLISLGGLLFSNYSYIYDDIMLALPCLILFCRLREGTLTSYERIALFLLMFIPIVAIKLHHMYIPYCFIAISYAYLITFLKINQTDAVTAP